MSIAEIRQLPLHEKMQIMEALWDDLRAHVEGLPVPGWHKELLDARRKALAEGKEEVLEWDDVKGSLGTRRTRFTPCSTVAASRIGSVIASDVRAHSGVGGVSGKSS